jgi:glycine cleavage system protein P-like pyridoxal-binding family
MAGLKVVPVKSLQDGNLDLADLKEKAEKHKDNLATLMVRPDEIPCFHYVIDFPRSRIRLHSASSKMVSLM